MPEPVTCAILDDEPLAGGLLADYVAREPALALADVYTDPIAALPALRAAPPALLLLDVDMPGLSGLDLARLLPPATRVIFTTAHPQHAAESYEVRAVDYLLKPISFARFAAAIARALEGIAPEATQAAASSPEHLFVKNGHRTERLAVADIRYLSGAGDYLEIHLAGGGKVLTLENLGALSGRLSPKQFCRIHRSHVVARAHIDYVERGRVVLGDVRLPVSEGYAEGFRAWLGA